MFVGNGESITGIVRKALWGTLLPKLAAKDFVLRDPGTTKRKALGHRGSS